MENRKSETMRRLEKEEQEIKELLEEATAEHRDRVRTRRSLDDRLESQGRVLELKRREDDVLGRMLRQYGREFALMDAAVTPEQQRALLQQFPRL